MSPEEDVKRALADARERLAAMEVEMRGLRQLAEGVRFAGEQSVRLGERFDAMKDAMHEVRADLADVSQGCKDVVKSFTEYKEANATAKINGRYLLYAAFATGCVGIIAKLLGVHIG